MGGEGKNPPTDNQPDQDTEQDATFESKLKGGRERFLAEVAAEVLRTGERDPDDFIRHFPPTAIMEGLREQPKLRARILMPTTGAKPKLAEMKSAESAGEDLKMTLEAGETSTAEILSAFDPDDRVQFLSHEKLWALVIESEFWNRQRDEDTFERARTLITFILERALVHELLTLRDIVYPVAMKKVRSDLTTDVLWDIIRTALETPEKFDYSHFLEGVPLDTLTKHVELWVFWEQIIALPIAERYGFVPCPDPPEATEGNWDPSELTQGVESDPPQAAAETVDLDEGDVTEVTEEDSEAPKQPDTKGVFDAAPPSEPEASGSPGETARTTDAGGGDDADISVEVSEVPEELLDAVEEEEGETVIAEPTFSSDAPPADYVPDAEFDAARAVSGAEDRVSTPGSVSTSEDMVKKSVISSLRSNAGLELMGVEEASIKEVIIHALAELNPKKYGGKALELREGPTSGLAKSLVNNLREKKGKEVAETIQGYLSALKSGSVVTQNPDPKARKNR